MDFVRATEWVLWSAYVLSYHYLKQQNKQRKIQEPDDFYSYTKITKQNMRNLFEVFGIQEANRGRSMVGSVPTAVTIESYFRRKRDTQEVVKEEIDSLVEHCFLWALDVIHDTKLWGGVKEGHRRMIISSLAEYCFRHPSSYQFVYYDSQDQQQQREMLCVKTVNSFCKEMGIVSEATLGIEVTLHRYGVIFETPRQAMQYICDAHSNSKKQTSELSKPLGRKIYHSLMYMRARAKGWLPEYDHWEQQHYYEDALSYAENELDMATTKRLEVDSLISIGGRFYREKAKRLMQDVFRFFRGYTSKDTNLINYEVTRGNYQLYVLDQADFAIGFYQKAKELIIETKGSEWNHHLFGYTLLHIDICNRLLGDVSTEEDIQLLKRMMPFCNFSNYYQLCSEQRQFAMLSLQKLVQ